MFSITFYIPPDRDEVVADITVSDCQLAEIRREADKRLIEFYPRPDGRPWQLDLAELQQSLESALSQLNSRLP
jgi:hypothetical protein